MSHKITPVDETINVCREYRIEGVPPKRKRFSRTIRYQPDNLRITWIAGEIDHVRLSGHRVLKSGEADGIRVSESFSHYSLRGADPDTPDWLRQFAFAETPGGAE